MLELIQENKDKDIGDVDEDDNEAINLPLIQEILYKVENAVRWLWKHRKCQFYEYVTT